MGQPSDIRRLRRAGSAGPQRGSRTARGSPARRLPLTRRARGTLPRSPRLRGREPRPSEENSGLHAKRIREPAQRVHFDVRPAAFDFADVLDVDPGRGLEILLSELPGAQPANVRGDVRKDIWLRELRHSTPVLRARGTKQRTALLGCGDWLFRERQSSAERNRLP